MDLIHRQTLDRLVARSGAETRVRHFGCRQQLICLVFAPWTGRESLRDSEACLHAKPETLYHLGFGAPLARSTWAEANAQRDWRLWRDLSLGRVAQAPRLYAGENLGLELDNTSEALDSTTRDLSLSLFPWADFRSTKAGIKRPTQRDWRGPIPVVIDITAARQHDGLWLDELIFEAAAFSVRDRGSVDCARLARIAQAGAFFVTRAKDNWRFTRQRSLPVNFAAGLRREQIGKRTHAPSRAALPWPLRRVPDFAAETHRHWVFLSNNLQLPALSVARLYQLRWQVALVFRWIKQNLRIKHFFGNSGNAVRTQLWISLAVYVMIAILHKELKLSGTWPRTLPILSVHPFEKVPLDELLAETHFNSLMTSTSNQLTLW